MRLVGGLSLGRLDGLVALERKGVLSGWILRDEVWLKSRWMSGDFETWEISDAYWIGGIRGRRLEDQCGLGRPTARLVSIP